jgi:hypothetical protein
VGDARQQDHVVGLNSVTFNHPSNSIAKHSKVFETNPITTEKEENAYHLQVTQTDSWSAPGRVGGFRTDRLRFEGRFGDHYTRDEGTGRALRKLERTVRGRQYGPLGSFGSFGTNPRTCWKGGKMHTTSKSLKLTAGALLVALAVFGLTGCGGGGRGGGGTPAKLAPSVIFGS